MRLRGLVLRFAAMYIGGIVAFSFIANIFGFGKIQGIEVGILSGAVIYAVNAMQRAKKRAIQIAEAWRAILGMLLVDAVFQTLIALAFGAAAAGAEVLNEYTFYLLLIVVVMHGLPIIAMTFLSRWMFSRQIVRQG